MDVNLKIYYCNKPLYRFLYYPFSATKNLLIFRRMLTTTFLPLFSGFDFMSERNKFLSRHDVLRWLPPFIHCFIADCGFEQFQYSQIGRNVIYKNDIFFSFELPTNK